MMQLALPDKAKRPQFWAGFSVFVAVLIGLGWLYSSISRWLEDEQRVPVQEIIVSGERRYLDDELVKNIIRRSQPGSFFELDVNEALNAVEGLAWVHKASIRKEWPARLKVYVIEQQPVAHWNDDMLLNPRGVLFSADKQGAALTLPHLFGPGGSELTALQGFYDMQGLLNASGLVIEELQLSERYAWQLRLSNGVRLNIGRQEFTDRVQRFVDLYPLLMQDGRQLDYVDLRYDTGMAVGWKSES
ncbi:cell division protein FtsQ/DivIB [Bowmanella sp. JS7-9]|uniref:Cell division protein FtsQ n=2 Tax=Pseudobowmanella zhangzhouensis TaxID=1537679 RepID=A0ABW1XFI9_9ALTE|nr:cell division protein FtsQ/DivIB [Bowmanella sp. JS7-9]TBX21301.1 cell division protein FtsQ [Bowmanella sp. JS7-9]